MSDFRLRPGKPVAQELAHVLEEQLKRARAKLKDWAGEPERAFHEARRRLKKARAVARVARGVDDTLARKINDLARDASSALSGPRDADVVRGVAAKLATETSDKTISSALAKFALHAGDVASEGIDRKALAEKAQHKIDAALKASEKLGDAEAPAKTLKRAVKKAFRRADRAFIAAHPGNGRGSKASEEIRHEWRKRVKDLWYAERLFEDIWPIDRRPHERLTNRLGKLLGAERDLLLLADRLHSAARACGGAKARDAALDYVQAKRDAILVEAEALGRRVHGAEFAPTRAAAARTGRGAKAQRRVAKKPTKSRKA